MNKTYFIKLLGKYLKDQASKEECDYLFAYYNLFEKEPDLKDLLNEKQREEIKNQIQKDIWKAIDRFQKDQILSERNEGERDKVFLNYEKLVIEKSKYSFLRLKSLKIAATLFIFSSIIFLLFKGQLSNQHNRDIVSGSTFENDIAPGTDKATLLLSDGTMVDLSDSTQREIVLSNGSLLVKSENGQLVFNLENASPSKGRELKYSTLTTPRGGQYQIVLPDGSKVWLNSASSLTFPEQFEENRRVVELTGEAYFEIESVILPSTKLDKGNKEKAVRTPFFVKTEGQVVEVMGTKFNINAYEDEMTTHTTLVEGSVKVTSSAVDKSILLIPNQQSLLWAKDKGLSVRSVDVKSIIGWKDGLFSFKNDDLSTVMMQLSRWYDVDVVYEGSLPKRQFSGEISRDINISGILDFLSFLEIEFRIENNGTSKRVVVF